MVKRLHLGPSRSPMSAIRATRAPSTKASRVRRASRSAARAARARPRAACWQVVSRARALPDRRACSKANSASCACSAAVNSIRTNLRPASATATPRARSCSSVFPATSRRTLDLRSEHGYAAAECRLHPHRRQRQDGARQQLCRPR
jgi:hypothetical protein